jgi:hypothetical protein
VGVTQVWCTRRRTRSRSAGHAEPLPGGITSRLPSWVEPRPACASAGARSPPAATRCPQSISRRRTMV